MMFLDTLSRKARQRLIMLGVEILFRQFVPVNVNLAVPDLDHLARKSDDAFDVALVRFLRIPEHNDVTSFYVAPANAFDAIINELVNQQPLAVMKFGQPRRSFDDDGLNGKHAKKYKDHD